MEGRAEGRSGGAAGGGRARGQAGEWAGRRTGWVSGCRVVVVQVLVKACGPGVWDSDGTESCVPEQLVVLLRSLHFHCMSLGAALQKKTSFFEKTVPKLGTESAPRNADKTATPTVGISFFDAKIWHGFPFRIWEFYLLESGLLDTAAGFVVWPCFFFFHLRGWGMSGDTSIRPCTPFFLRPRDGEERLAMPIRGSTSCITSSSTLDTPAFILQGMRCYSRRRACGGGGGGVICDSRCSHGSISPEVVGGNHTQGARTTPFARWGFGRGPWDPSSSPLRTPFDEEVAGRPRSGLEGCTAGPRRVP